MITDEWGQNKFLIEKRKTMGQSDGYMDTEGLTALREVKSSQQKEEKSFFNEFESLEKVKKMIKFYPNDSELGQEIRKLFS